MARALTSGAACDLFAFLASLTRSWAFFFSSLFGSRTLGRSSFLPDRNIAGATFSWPLLGMYLTTPASYSPTMPPTSKVRAKKVFMP